MNLEPNKLVSVTLPNSKWVFISDLLRQLNYGDVVDAGQHDLLIELNNQIIEANKDQQTK